MAISDGDGGPGLRTAAVWVLAAAGVLLAVFAWGLRLVVVEARAYATVHGLPADTSSDQVTVVVTLVLATGLLTAAVLLGRSRSSAGTSPRG